MTVAVHVENIFPTPIYISSINVDSINVDDVVCISNGPKKILKLSENDCLLNEEKFSNLKSEINQHANHFYHNVLGYSNKVYPEMTCSWLVRSLPDQESEWHIHGNSVFSGILYLNAPEKCGDISFGLYITDDRQIITYLQPPIQTDTIYNNRVFSFSPKTGMLLMFPSSLRHKVEKNQSTEERLSIAFNYFLKGNFDRWTAKLELN